MKRFKGKRTPLPEKLFSFERDTSVFMDRKKLTDKSIFAWYFSRGFYARRQGVKKIKLTPCACPFGSGAEWFRVE